MVHLCRLAFSLCLHGTVEPLFQLNKDEQWPYAQKDWKGSIRGDSMGSAGRRESMPREPPAHTLKDTGTAFAPPRPCSGGRCVCQAPTVLMLSAGCGWSNLIIAGSKHGCTGTQALTFCVGTRLNTSRRTCRTGRTPAGGDVAQKAYMGVFDACASCVTAEAKSAHEPRDMTGKAAWERGGAPAGAAWAHGEGGQKKRRSRPCSPRVGARAARAPLTDGCAARVQSSPPWTPHLRASWARPHRQLSSSGSGFNAGVAVGTASGH